jgi:F0F1-type ATP synthase assembly protein I
MPVCVTCGALVDWLFRTLPYGMLLGLLAGAIAWMPCANESRPPRED